jgi:hypothetical protein
MPQDIDLNQVYAQWKHRCPDIVQALGIQKEVDEAFDYYRNISRLNEHFVGMSENDIILERIRIEGSNDLTINEATVKELYRGADKARLGRSKQIRMQYRGVTNKRGWVAFQCKSQYNPNKFYTQYIKLLDLKDARVLKDMKKQDATRLLLYGDVACFCSCPDFKFKGFKHMAHAMGYGMYKEPRFPHIRNPRLEGTVCKHLLAVFSVFMNNWMSIHRDLVRSKAWDKNYVNPAPLKVKRPVGRPKKNQKV